MNILKGFQDFNCKVDVYDPWVNKDEAPFEFNINLIEAPKKGKYDAVILAVAHNEFKGLSAVKIKSFGKDNHVLYDVKCLLDVNESDGRL